MDFIKLFRAIDMQDVALVGGKNASLGQMIGRLAAQGICVPDGFAVTVAGYWFHLKNNELQEKLKTILSDLTLTTPLDQLHKAGHKARELIVDAPLPELLEKQISDAYKQLCKTLKKINCSVAVRSSATAEDLPNASFAGQQETFLNVRGVPALLKAYKECIASLFTDRALAYRMEKGFDHFAVALSVGVQQMVRSDKGAAGVMFTLDTETGFKDVVVINSSYGLGESVVLGQVVPDEFHVFKTTLKTGGRPIIKKQCGQKAVERVFAAGRNSVKIKKVTKKRTQQFSLTDDEILQLARYALIIEEHYSKLKGEWSPMDIEWAKDGVDKQLYIVQARPETVHTGHDNDLQTCSVKVPVDAQVLVTGQSVGQSAVTGTVRIIKSPAQGELVKKGDIIVTRMTDPDWVPVMRKAAGIITESGGRTCHAAIVSRELGIPAIVGAAGCLTKLKNETAVTLDCSQGSQGMVYEGTLEIVHTRTAIAYSKKPPVSLLVNIGSPDRAYKTAQLPVDGVGLARVEFIISNQVQVHPMLCAVPHPDLDKRLKKKLETLTAAYKTPADFFVDNVAQGIGMIAAAFYPRPVLVRFSDFKSNEYRNLVGGTLFEPVEENPMMGLRGASRYQHELYAPAFALECQAVKYAREVMGLTNINVMIPFVRTLTEAQGVKELLTTYGLVSGDKGPAIYMMCEIPSNVILMEQFAQHFDGFSIGSNDLTQTTLSVDRDSGLLAHLFDERDPAVMAMLAQALSGAQAAGKPIGICGQAPSDHPAIAQFLIDRGINSLSLNPDSVIPFLARYQ